MCMLANHTLKVIFNTDLSPHNKKNCPHGIISWKGNAPLKLALDSHFVRGTHQILAP